MGTFPRFPRAFRGTQSSPACLCESSRLHTVYLISHGAWPDQGRRLWVGAVSEDAYVFNSVKYMPGLSYIENTYVSLQRKRLDLI